MAIKPKEMKKSKSSITESNVVPITPIDSGSPSVEPLSPQTEIIRRDEKGRFLKGFSGNPHAWATRKLNTPLALLCREKVEKWAEVLDSIITGPTVDPMVKLGALKLGFQYGFGNPLQGSEARDFEKEDYIKFVEFLKKEVENRFGSLYSIKPRDKGKIKEFIASVMTSTDALDQVCRDILEPSPPWGL